MRIAATLVLIGLHDYRRSMTLDHSCAACGLAHTETGAECSSDSASRQLFWGASPWPWFGWTGRPRIRREGGISPYMDSGIGGFPAIPRLSAGDGSMAASQIALPSASRALVGYLAMRRLSLRPLGDRPTVCVLERPDDDHHQVDQCPNGSDEQADAGNRKDDHHNSSPGLPHIEAMDTKDTDQKGENGRWQYPLLGAPKTAGSPAASGLAARVWTRSPWWNAKALGALPLLSDDLLGSLVIVARAWRCVGNRIATMRASGGLIGHLFAALAAGNQGHGSSTGGACHR